MRFRISSPRSGSPSGSCRSSVFGDFAMPKEYRLMGEDYKFSPTGGPIDSPKENADLFCTLGLAQAAWSRMEHMVTVLALHLNKEEASAALHDPDPADAFRRKLKLL